ncbi:group 1 truncated hemoglobin [Pendulispora albinea]|uniref:Group 1 truncated hemoglobin n=1 Tax=Pendulispora albinea TaxID=2741071 RepID=A0ABZ2M5G2_9BACT
MRLSSLFGPNVTTKRAIQAALISTAMLGSFAAFGAGCGSKKPPTPPEPALIETADAGPPPEPEDAGPPAPKSLYERLNGREGIDKLVDALVQNASADGKLKKSFAKLKGEKLENFKKNLAEHICEIAGGPCKYTGGDVKSPHDSVNINDAQWDAFVQDFNAAVDEAKIDEKDKNELIALFAELRGDVVASKKSKK